MVPHAGEPEADPWRVELLAELIRMLLPSGPPPDRPAVVAVGGRSSAGKTTLAGRVAAAIPACVVVHTDDIAWHHAVLDWVDMLVGGVLEPARRGEPVRDPFLLADRAWERATAIVAGTPVLPHDPSAEVVMGGGR